MTLMELAREKNLTYHIETYGCQMNCHDSERIAGVLEESGFSRAAAVEEASLVIFNTCCVREAAEKKLFSNVGALTRLPNGAPITVIMGCMMQQSELAKRAMRTFPFVYGAMGTRVLTKLPEVLYRAFAHNERTLAIEELDTGFEDLPMVRNARPLATVSIMQGCDNFCSYCIVPYVRGRERSRDAEAILDEVRSVVKDGYKEVMLLGQNVNSYAKKEGGMSFPELLERVAEDTGIERIRFMTSHPKDISLEMLEVMAKHDNICKQLHLPAQSGSDRILDMMNRKYTREHYLSKIKAARELMPEIVLSTDIIVGFPGETDEDFEATLSLMQEVRYDSAFTFVYSPRTGTKAAEMENQIPEEVKKYRINKLVEIQNEITYEKNLERVGDIETVLVEGASTRGEDMCGRTDGGRMVNFAADGLNVGDLVKVEIVEAKRTTLYGRLLK